MDNKVVRLRPDSEAKSALRPSSERAMALEDTTKSDTALVALLGDHTAKVSTLVGMVEQFEADLMEFSFSPEQTSKLEAVLPLLERVNRLRAGLHAELLRTARLVGELRRPKQQVRVRTANVVVVVPGDAPQQEALEQAQAQ